MALVEHNVRLGGNICLLTARLDGSHGEPQPGQFFMLRTWHGTPLLNRPLAVFDYDQNEHKVKFLYEVVGKGTLELASVSPNSDIEIYGPFGSGFPDIDTDLLIVGGGIGVAPLYYAAKRFKERHPNRMLRTFVGFSDYLYQFWGFNEISDETYMEVGGKITDRVFLKEEKNVFAYGPEPMMVELGRIIPKNVNLYESFEGRMACGFGSCLTCASNVPIIYKERENRLELVNPLLGKKYKICTDGPVFLRKVI